MSVTEDVLADYLAAYPQLSRSQLEEVLSTLSTTTSASDGMETAIAVAIKGTMPGAAQRITEYSGADATEYLRILKGALIFTLGQWESPEQPGPSADRITAMVENVDGP